MLLDLPPELVQLVFKHASTPSYLQAAVTCRTLFEISSTCREVILHHLRRTPGLTQGIESMKTRDLFLLLRRRAAKQLYGANFSANRTLYNFEGQTIDARASSVGSSWPNVALVVKGENDGTLHLLDAGHGSVSRRFSLRHRYEQPGKVEVLRTAFAPSGDVAVLQRFIPEVEVPDAEGDSSEHPFVKQVRQSPPNEEIHLLYYDCRIADPRIMIYTFADRSEYEPLAFDIGDRDCFAISWKHREDDDQHEVVLYSASLEDDDETGPVSHLTYKQTIVLDDTGQWPERHNHSRPSRAPTLADVGDTLLYSTPVTDLAFNDAVTQLLYYYPGTTLYGLFQNITATPGQKPISARTYLNLCRVQFTESLTLPFSIDIPFFGTHATENADPFFQVCHWKYLAFGTATHREENWTVACLLRSEARCRASNCEHVLNLDRGRRFADWTIVARLWGYKKPSNSLGNIVAPSRRGTRIAVANWKEIYIWALEPRELIEDNENEFYPPCWYSTNPPGIVELRPIVLRVEAVCFKLWFGPGEDELLALTDRGLMHWYLGPRGTGLRRACKLERPEEM